MIGYLEGRVIALDDANAIINVGGVGYEVHGTPRLLTRLAIGDDVALHIETIVREDLIRLYGFDGAAERRAFTLLQSVQGVGAKHALAILHVLPPDDLFEAVLAEDVTVLTRAHGVGRKLAQRLVTELQSKVGGIAKAGADLKPVAVKLKAAAPNETVPAGGGTIRADAVSALINLGYDSLEARRTVSALAETEGSLEGIIKAALKELSAA